MKSGSPLTAAAAAAPEDKQQQKEEEEEEAWVWSWGAGTDGQLGTGGFQDHHLPQPLLLPTRCRRRVSSVSGGGAHAIALTSDGEVFTWGRGTHGQLGHGNMENCPQPKLVKFLESYAVTCVSAGWNHSGFATDAGRLFLCGDGSFGQLGTGNNLSRSLPFEVEFFTTKHVEKLAFGMRHSLVLLKNNSVYGFGSARRGQVGKCVSRTQNSYNTPRLIDGFPNCKIADIYANGDHSAALDESGQLYIWGRALSGEPDDHRPRQVASSLRISQVALGWHHALVLASGEVYTIGACRHQKLNHSESANPVEQQSNPTTSSIICDESSSLPVLEKSPCIDSESVGQIAAGSEHSALATDKGTILTWGWGEHGQLGLGDTCDQVSPHTVDIGDKRPCSSASLRVYCGSGFTIVVDNA